MDRDNIVETVLGAALFAAGRGAKGLRIDLDAVQLLRQRFQPLVRAAVDDPDWYRKWLEEQPYVVVQAEAMGRTAAQLAAQDGRVRISGRDVEIAMLKLRGRLPIAGRWCPF
jgi:histone H3/H4